MTKFKYCGDGFCPQKNECNRFLLNHRNLENENGRINVTLHPPRSHKGCPMFEKLPKKERI